MSAIAGIINFNKEPIKVEEIHSVMGALAKFPADDIQVWNNENVFFGCHAQWITPESVGEPLPFYDSERQCTITADAIIDNREELFESLQVHRDKRKTTPDSQLILLAYYKWGEDTPKHLVGDFAFMIWDEREQKLFGARDFSGSRTLYYYHDQNHLAFCTVMEPLFTLPYIRKELNEEWLAEFLAITGVVDVVDMFITVYKNIKQVPPSYSISIIEGKINLKRYLQLNDKKVYLKSDEEYVEAFQDVFQKAVNDRLRTYRQVGAHLSGGLDSGSVVSFAAKSLRKENKTMHTFSYIPPNDFKDWTPENRLADERPFIKSTVEYVGAIKDYYLDFEGKSPLTEIDDFLEIMEMPYKFFENSFWLSGIFEKASEKEVGVLLNGGRGNLSISWGSAVDYYALLLKRLNLITLSNELKLYSNNMGTGRKQVLSFVGRRAFPLIERLFPSVTPYKYPELINPIFANKTGVYEKLNDYGMNLAGTINVNAFKERKKHFQQLYHWNATNTLGAKLSLRHSLWKRDPTNDLMVIRHCLSVPEEQYVKNGYDRALIRRSTKSLLPDKVRLNQQIRGIQGADWVHRMISSWDKFKEELQQIQKDPFIFEFLNKEVVSAAIEQMKKAPNSEDALDPNMRILVRALIVYRFLKKIA